MQTLFLALNITYKTSALRNVIARRDTIEAETFNKQSIINRCTDLVFINVNMTD